MVFEAWFNESHGFGYLPRWKPGKVRKLRNNLIGLRHEPVEIALVNEYVVEVSKEVPDRLIVVTDELEMLKKISPVPYDMALRTFSMGPPGKDYSHTILEWRIKVGKGERKARILHAPWWISPAPDIILGDG